MSVVIVDSHLLRHALCAFAPPKPGHEEPVAFKLMTHQVQIKVGWVEVSVRGRSYGPVEETYASAFSNGDLSSVLEKVPASSPLRIEISGGKLRLGELEFVDHWEMSNPFRALNAGPELLERFEADEADENSAERVRLDRSIGEAAEKLEWLGIGVHRLQLWISDALGTTPLPTPDRTAGAFGFEDLVDAWIDRNRYLHTVDDLATAFGNKFRALTLAFGADISVRPRAAPFTPNWIAARGPNDEARWAGGAHWVHDYVLRLEHEFRAPNRPVVLCSPDALAPILQRYSPGLNAARNALEKRQRQTIGEILAQLFPDAAQRVVTADDVRANGFDPAAAMPDPNDYW